MLARNDIVTTLHKVRALIADRNHWTKFWLAKAANGDTVEPEDKTAVRFCIAGAFMRVGGSGLFPDTTEPAWRALSMAAHNRFGLTTAYNAPIYVNNTYGHRATLRMIDDAIALAAAEESHARTE